MAAKTIVFGIILVFLVSILVFCVELFLPVSMKADIDTVCRGVLLEMENAGGLSAGRARELRTELEEMGLTEVKVTATEKAMQGERLTLTVEAVYTYDKLVAFLKREKTAVRMVYNKTSVSRRVVN